MKYSIITGQNGTFFRVYENGGGKVNIGTILSQRAEIMKLALNAATFDVENAYKLSSMASDYLNCERIRQAVNAELKKKRNLLIRYQCPFCSAVSFKKGGKKDMACSHAVSKGRDILFVNI